MGDALGIPDKAHDSLAVEVTFFEDRAEVVREAMLALAAGPQWVVLRGMTPFLDDRSVRATSEAGTVVSTRVVRRYVSERGGSPADVAAIEDRLRELQRKIAYEEARGEKAEARSALVDELLGAWLQELQAVPRGIGAEGGQEEWRASWARFEAEQAAARGEILASRAAAEELRRENTQLSLQLGELRRERSRLETIVGVQVDAAREGEAKVRVTYRTPCALWRPEHLARLAKDGAKGRVELVTFASAWQATGEEWKDVAARFSTARPARPAHPPLLTDDVLALRKKSDEERKQVVIEARDQAIQVTGADGGRKAVDEMPGVDDGGEPLTYEAIARVTIPSNGRPFRIEVQRRELEADVSLVAYPERSIAPHVRALATLAGAGPLLAGPVRVAREGALVGRARLDFTAPGEAVEISFGPDDGLRVRRTTREERDTQPITGRQKYKRIVKLYLSNMSGEERTVRVVERVPVSEIEELEIALVEAGGFKAEGKDGLVVQQVPLAPRATKTLELAWEARAGSKVVLPF